MSDSGKSPQRSSHRFGLIGLTVIAALLAVGCGVMIAHPYTPHKPASKAELPYAPVRVESTNGLPQPPASIMPAGPLVLPAADALGVLPSSYRMVSASSRVDRTLRGARTFSGSYDDGAGGLVVGFTAEPSVALRRKVAATVPRDIAVHFVRQRSSLDALGSIANDIQSERVAREQAGVVDVEIDVRDNEVEVTVSSKADVRAASVSFGRREVNIVVGSGVDFQVASTLLSGDSPAY